MVSFALAKLVNRKLIKISGPDCYPYLQSLFCNDLRLLYEPDRIKTRKYARPSSSVISSFMLNAQGKAICDILVYRTPHTRYQCSFTPPGEAKEPDELLIECDSSLAGGLASTLYGYRVRRKISLEIMQNHSVWCLFPKYDNDQQITQPNEISLIEASNALTNTKEIMNNDITLVGDPRLDSLGMRLLNYDDASKQKDDSEFNKLKDILQSQININLDKASLADYTVHRYRLGVGEGPNDHLESNCFPLECNADFLGSVSFDKGCYLGQELTARIHFTGVIRKRLMPIIVHKDTKQSDTVPLVSGTDIIEERSGKKLGTLRHLVRGHALALLRHDLINEDTNLIHDGSRVKISTWKPYWWQ